MGISFGGLLGGASALDRALNAKGKGEREAGQASSALDRELAKAAREQEESALDMELKRSQVGKVRAETGAIGAPKKPTPQYDSERGGFVTPGGGFEAVLNLPPKPAKADGLKEVMRGGRRVYARESEAVGQEAPAPPSPVETHRENRAFDVANPLPVQRVPRQPTEVQSRARLVYPRAQAAAAELERFFKSGAPIKSEAGKMPLVGNFVLNKDEQMMNQAAETIASSILRLESGANYTKNEMLSYKKQFLPAPGDSPETLAQKRATLMEQLSAMKELADRGAPPPAATASSGHGAPGNVDLGKPSLAERVKQLKAQGVDKATAKATLAAEGYTVPE